MAVELAPGYSLRCFSAGSRRTRICGLRRSWSLGQDVATPGYEEPHCNRASYRPQPHSCSRSSRACIERDAGQPLKVYDSRILAGHHKLGS